VSARAETIRPGSAAECATAAAVVILGCALLMLRLQVLGRSGAAPLLAATYVAILSGAILVRVPAGLEGRPSTGPIIAATLMGAGAVVAAATVAGPSIPVPVPALALVMNALAAVGEEALFRRAAFGWLARFGPVTAVVATAVLFALVHVPVYGASALPVDLGAGLLFGWQRAVSGTWTVPAATHVVANLVTVLR
jgi:membrane protease YdiL (CAAX protease family)